MAETSSSDTPTENEDYCWPDPGPNIHSNRSANNEEEGGMNDDDDDHFTCTHINDVSRMSSFPNGSPISRIFFPRCEKDVMHILQAAQDANKCVGIRGTKHSMGGHSIASQVGWEIDTKFLRHIEYDAVNEPGIVRCGPGCQWSDLIKVLNAYGKSPRTMQSYCSFSVGGTLAVNAHGITTDYCFAESVVEMRLARVSTKGQATIVDCKPPSQNGSTFSNTNRDEGAGKSSNTAGQKKKSLSAELFSLVLGGYGLFGVITEVVLKVQTNVKLEADSMQLNVNRRGDENCSEFIRIYDNCRNVNEMKHDDNEDGTVLGTSLGKVEIKLARLNTITLDKASFYVFRNSAPSSAISDLPASPRELSAASRLLYKWALPLLKEKRYAQEENSGKALDWSQDDSLTRNQLLYESAVPLAKLYEPLLKKDDTFILQEFFCPHDKMMEWIEAVKPIYKDIEQQQHEHGQDLILLNTTIRYVEKDDITFLSYSRVPGGVFAFVLYYRIKRDTVVERRLGDFHNRLAKVTIDLGGSFYLPYRKCYSIDLLKAAYPMIEDFAEKKEKFDPDCLFSNLWFEHYVLPLCTKNYRSKWTVKHEQKGTDENGPTFDIDTTFVGTLPKVDEAKTKEEFLEWLPRKDHPRMLRRTNSYRSLIRSKELRDQFREQFLVQIFNLADPDEVMRVMTRAAWDPLNHDDFQIYRFVYGHFHGTSGKNGQNISKILPQFWRGIQQLRQQKEELTRQTMNILMRLEKIGKVNDYVCIGDHGKTVIQFVQKLQMNGKIWVLHNSEDMIDQKVEKPNSSNKVPSIGTVLERGSLDSVAHEEILYDYCTDIPHEKLGRIPSNSVDLVTMNQGLHHIPLDNLFEFLVEVKRIVRPGGIFIIREHDLQLSKKTNNKTTKTSIGKVPYPMLDLAHSIFNAVTGVTVKEEIEEIRAFRPIMEWRAILAKVGFIDTLVSDVEDGDPTWDEMLAFCKPIATNQDTISPPVAIETPTSISRSLFDTENLPIMSLIRTLLGQIPASTALTMEKILHFIKQWLPKVNQSVCHAILNEIPKILQELGMADTNVGLITRQGTALLETKLVAAIEQMVGVVEGALSLLSQSEIQKFYNFKNLVYMPELFLLLPYLERKVELEGENCNEVEKMLITFVREYFPVFLFEEKKERECNSEAPDGQLSEVDSASANMNNETGEVTQREVQIAIENLTESIPGLLDPDIFLVQSGFTLSQQTSLIAKFGGNDFSSFCRSLAGYLDRVTWTEMKTKLIMVEESKELPTKNRLLSSTESHPWYLVMKTLMKSPKVILNGQAIFGLKMIGLGEVGTLYKAAKKEQSKEPIEHLHLENDLVTYLHSMDQSLEELGNKWTKDIVEKKITFNGSCETSLWDVAEVISAKFGYNSLTSRKVDVTRELQQIHARIHAKIANPEYNFRIPPNVQLGWLPITEEMLIQIRNKGSVQKEVGDALRKNLVKVASVGLAGDNQLKIKYRRIIRDVNEKNRRRDNNHNNPVPDNVIQSALHSGLVENIITICGSLGEVLEANDIVRKDLHPSDGHYTFFKLNEWMQVEILEELVKSLDHTPWYRFPFMSFITTYFDVFRQQCQIVQQKYGTLTAYNSTAFFVDLIPGLVMSVLFGQLQVLAAPLKMMTPSDGYAGLDQSRFLEEIILHVHQLPQNVEVSNGTGSNNKNNNDWDRFFQTEVDARILKAKKLPGNFVIITTPPFKAMGEVLIRFAKRFPASRVFQISNQQEVQVRISRTFSTDAMDTTSSSREVDVNVEEEHDHDLERLTSLPRVERLMHYQFPDTFGSGDQSSSTRPLKKYYCLQVHCLSLLEVIRTCSLLPNYEVEQIYDFWN